MKSMSHSLSNSFIVLCLASLLSVAQADTATLYLLNGTTVRGEIVDRSTREVQLKTPSGVVKVKTAKLMPISRAQLKLPAEVEKDETGNLEMEAVITQMEKLLAENESLKQQLEVLKNQLAKTSPELVSPAEGPTAKR